MIETLALLFSSEEISEAAICMLGLRIILTTSFSLDVILRRLHYGLLVRLPGDAYFSPSFETELLIFVEVLF